MRRTRQLRRVHIDVPLALDSRPDAQYAYNCERPDIS